MIEIRYIGSRDWHDQTIARNEAVRPPVLFKKGKTSMLQVHHYGTKEN